MKHAGKIAAVVIADGICRFLHPVRAGLQEQPGFPKAQIGQIFKKRKIALLAEDMREVLWANFQGVGNMVKRDRFRIMLFQVLPGPGHQ